MRVEYKNGVKKLAFPRKKGDAERQRMSEEIKERKAHQICLIADDEESFIL